MKYFLLSITITILIVGAYPVFAQTQTNTWYDSHGVQMLYPQKQGGQSIEITGNPNSQLGIRLDCGSKAVSHTEGNFSYYSITPRNGSLSSGAIQPTCRLDFTPILSLGSQSTWQIALQRGYMVSPSDIDEFEQTGYFRFNNVTQDDDLTLKQGGAHTDSNPGYAGSYGMEVDYFGKYTEKIAEKELNHPHYEFFKGSTNYPTGNIVGKWIGVKEISFHVPTGQEYQLYLDLDPINFTTGLPNNNWKLFDQIVDDGKEINIYHGNVTTFGKKTFTWRIDYAKNIDFAYPSVHHIVMNQVVIPPITNQTIVTTVQNLTNDISSSNNTTVTVPTNQIVSTNETLPLNDTTSENTTTNNEFGLNDFQLGNTTANVTSPLPYDPYSPPLTPNGTNLLPILGNGSATDTISKPMNQTINPPIIYTTNQTNTTNHSTPKTLDDIYNQDVIIIKLLQQQVKISEMNTCTSWLQGLLYSDQALKNCEALLDSRTS